MKPSWFLVLCFQCLFIYAHATESESFDNTAHQIVEMNSLGVRGFSVGSRSEVDTGGGTLLFDVLVDWICFDVEQHDFTRRDCLDDSSVYPVLKDNLAINERSEEFFLVYEKDGEVDKYFGFDGYRSISPRDRSFPRNVFREYTDAGFTAFHLAIPVGELPRKKLDKDPKFQELNEFFLKHCGELLEPAAVPKKIMKDFSRGRKVDLKDWLSAFERPRNNSTKWHLAVIIKDFTKVRADLSNMEATCAWSHGRGLNPHETRYYSREFALISPTLLFDKAASTEERFLLSKREKLKEAISELLEEEAQMTDRFRSDGFLNWVNEMEQVALRRSEYPLLASYPYREIEDKLAPKSEYESATQFEQRSKAAKESTESFTVIVPGNAFSYDADEENFDYPSSFCNTNTKLLEYEHTESWVGQNAFGASRIVESYQGKELIHRLDGFDTLEIQSALLNYSIELSVPIKEARAYEGMQAVCIAQFYPNWSNSYSKSFSSSAASYNSPREYSKELYYVQAEPLAWVVIDRNNRSILSFMPLFSDGETIKTVRRLKGEIWWASAQRNITPAKFYLEELNSLSPSLEHRKRYNAHLDYGVRPLSYKELIGDYPISPMTDAEFDLNLFHLME